MAPDPHLHLPPLPNPQYSRKTSSSGVPTPGGGSVSGDAPGDATPSVGRSRRASSSSSLHLDRSAFTERGSNVERLAPTAVSEVTSSFQRLGWGLVRGLEQGIARLHVSLERGSGAQGGAPGDALRVWSSQCEQTCVGGHGCARVTDGLGFTNELESRMCLSHGVVSGLSGQDAGSVRRSGVAAACACSEGAVRLSARLH